MPVVKVNPVALPEDGATIKASRGSQPTPMSPKRSPRSERQTMTPNKRRSGTRNDCTLESMSTKQALKLGREKPFIGQNGDSLSDHEHNTWYSFVKSNEHVAIPNQYTNGKDDVSGPRSTTTLAHTTLSNSSQSSLPGPSCRNCRDGKSSDFENDFDIRQCAQATASWKRSLREIKHVNAQGSSLEDNSIENDDSDDDTHDESTLCAEPSSINSEKSLVRKPKSHRPASHHNRTSEIEGIPSFKDSVHARRQHKAETVLCDQVSSGNRKMFEVQTMVLSERAEEVVNTPIALSPELDLSSWNGFTSSSKNEGSSREEVPTRAHATSKKDLYCFVRSSWKPGMVNSKLLRGTGTLEAVERRVAEKKFKSTKRQRRRESHKQKKRRHRRSGQSETHGSQTESGSSNRLASEKTRNAGQRATKRPRLVAKDVRTTDQEEENHRRERAGVVNGTSSGEPYTPRTRRRLTMLDIEAGIELTDTDGSDSPSMLRYQRQNELRRVDEDAPESDWT